MLELNETTKIWRNRLRRLLESPHNVVSPRGMEVREFLPGSYTVPMPAYINLESRNVNIRFQLAEALWILSGSNRVDELTPYMKRYADFSDDGTYMRGAYGPKIIDQVPWIVETLIKDNDTRQAVLTIWRERPGPSKDIPCTVSMQFFVRNGLLELVVYMRSQDVVLGFTYDVFTFSMVAELIRRELRASGLEVELGDLHVTAGSLHLYSNFYDKARTWLVSKPRVDSRVENTVDWVLKNSGETSKELIEALREAIPNEP